MRDKKSNQQRVEDFESDLEGNITQAKNAVNHLENLKKTVKFIAEHFNAYYDSIASNEDIPEDVRKTYVYKGSPLAMYVESLAVLVDSQITIVGRELKTLEESLTVRNNG